jgi:hypothetical protein
MLLIDLGSSATKIIVLFVGKKGRQGLAFIMSPFISVEMSKSFLPEFKPAVEPERQAWIELAGKYFVVGQAAEDDFVEHDIKAPKLEIAMKKILAVVWAISSRLALGSKFSISLYLMLPANERKDEETYQLKRRLVDALSSFDTPTGKMQVNLTHYQSMVEGIGSLNLILPLIQPGKYISPDIDALVGMFGFRNFSGFRISEGRIHPPFTEELGMHYILSRVVKEVPGQTVARLLEPLALVGSGFTDLDPLEPCLRSQDPEVKKTERENLIKVADQVTKIFLNTFVEFLRRHGKVPSIFYWYGGTADYLAPIIQTTFQDLEHHFHVGDHLLPSWIICTGQKSRFLDLWGAALRIDPTLSRGK